MSLNRVFFFIVVLCLSVHGYLKIKHSRLQAALKAEEATTPSEPNEEKVVKEFADFIEKKPEIIQAAAADSKTPTTNNEQSSAPSDGGIQEPSDTTHIPLNFDNPALIDPQVDNYSKVLGSPIENSPSPELEESTEPYNPAMTDPRVIMEKELQKY